MRLIIVLRSGILLGFFLVGCTSVNPTEQIGAFAEATKVYSTQAAAAYQDINNVTIERRVADLSTMNDPAMVGSSLEDDQTFEPFIEGADLGIRLQLLQALGNYAQGLGELASADFKKDIDTAAQQLGGAFKRLSDTVAAVDTSSTPISDAEAGAITAIVSAFGNAIAEQKRRDAIKEVVIKFNPVVQDAARILSKGEWSSLGDIAGINYNILYALDVMAYKAEQTKLSNAQRRQRLADIARRYSIKQGTKPLFAALVKSAVEVGDAHQTLYDAVSNNQFSSEEFASQIAELSSLVQSLSAFRARFASQP